MRNLEMMQERKIFYRFFQLATIEIELTQSIGGTAKKKDL